MNNCRSLGIYKSITHVLRAISTGLDHRKSQFLDRFRLAKKRELAQKPLWLNSRGFFAKKTKPSLTSTIACVSIYDPLLPSLGLQISQIGSFPLLTFKSKVQKRASSRRVVSTAWLFEFGAFSNILPSFCKDLQMTSSGHPLKCAWIEAMCTQPFLWLWGNYCTLKGTTL